MGKLKNLGSKLLAGPYVIWMLLFTVIPLGLIIYNGFTNSDGRFTFKYVAAIADPVNAKPLLLSFEMSLIVTVVCLLLAFPLAVILSKYSTDKNSFIVMIFILPMWMNFMLRTLAWRLILLNNGFLNQFLTMLGLSKVYLMNTKAAIIFGTAYDYFPFMVLPIYTVMSKIDNGLIEAAQDLGSNNFTVFRKVVAPLSVPGIISGVTMVFVPSASTFLVAQYLGGPDDIMIGDVIEKIFWTDQNTGSAISLILMIFIFVFLIIMNLFGDEEAIA